MSNSEAAVDGSYPGSTQNMTQVETRQGVTILECDYCGEQAQKNWGKAAAHTCGVGENMTGAGCCEEPELDDYWVTLEETDTGATMQERKKKCRNCGDIHPLEVMNRVEGQ